MLSTAVFDVRVVETVHCLIPMVSSPRCTQPKTKTFSSIPSILTSAQVNIKCFIHFQLRRVRTKSLGDGEIFRNNCSPSLHRRRHFVVHNKAPLWNENSQVYQLDFGGRVTQESAKNFQIEFRGKQVSKFNVKTFQCMVAFKA